MRSRRLLFVTAAALVAAPAAHAQVFQGVDASTPIRRLYGGLNGLVSVPQGEFRDFIKTGGGIGGHFIYQLDRSGVLALRLDVGGVMYGNERTRACFSPPIGCRIELEVNTSNNIFLGGIGPQLMVPTGTFTPYVAGTIGFAYFFTESSIEGTGSDVSFADTNNFDDGTLAWTALAGVYIPIRKGARPISLDLGASYHWNGEASYLRPGSIQDFPDGSIQINPLRSETNLLVFRLGITARF